MKSYKIFPLIFIVPLLLTACNKKPYYVGDYVFQMGKNKDTHMGVTLKLTDNYFDENNHDKGYAFELDIDMASSSNDSGGFMTMLESVNPIKGFYLVNEDIKIYDETKLFLGVGAEYFADYITSPEELENIEKLIDSIFVANVNKTTVNLYLPVSMDDLFLQLYWYGYDLTGTSSGSGEESTIDSPDGTHPVGNHPTEEDIAKVNEHYPATHGGKSFRDYHVLKLGLTKQ